MKVSSGAGLRNWVTLNLPAWLLLAVGLVILLAVLGMAFSPELAAKVAAAFYAFVQRMAGPPKP